MNLSLSCSNNLYTFNEGQSLFHVQYLIDKSFNYNQESIQQIFLDALDKNWDQFLFYLIFILFWLE